MEKSVGSAAGRFFVSIFEKAKITEKLTAVVSEQQFPVEWGWIDIDFFKQKSDVFAYA